MSEKNFMFESPRLSMISLSETDTDLMVKWRSDKESIKYFFNTEPLTREKHIMWYMNYLKNDLRLDFIVKEKHLQCPIGTVNIIFLTPNKSECEIGYSVFEKQFLGKGLGKESVLALIDFAKSIFGTRKFIAQIHKENIPSIKLINSCGFQFVKEEGVYSVYQLYE